MRPLTSIIAVLISLVLVQTACAQSKTHSPSQGKSWIDFGRAVHVCMVVAANEFIVGTWTWVPRDQIVTIKSGGECASTYNVTGKWRVLDARKRTFEIRWSSGFVDHLTLSTDGNKLTGSNQYGKQPNDMLRRN